MDTKESLLKQRNKLLVYSLVTGLGISTSLVAGLGIYTLIGCESDFSYNTGDNGQIEVSDTISYNNLIEYKFLVFHYPNNNIQIYMAEEDVNSNGKYNISKDYYDIETNQRILFISDNYSEKDYGLESFEEFKVENFLIEHKYQKNEYTIEDIRKYIDEFKVEYQENKNKQNKQLIKK